MFTSMCVKRISSSLKRWAGNSTTYTVSTQYLCHEIEYVSGRTHISKGSLNIGNLVTLLLYIS